MKVIKIVIEKSKDHYSAYAQNVDGIYGAGNTADEAKQSILQAIDIIKGFSPDNIPAALKGEYKLSYKLDTQSLLNYYKGIFNKKGLERLTGISQAQLQHYSKGLKKPRPEQSKKIEAAMHKLGSELMAVEL